jgi:tetratricopeptide (TPR) repeat protein
LLIVSFYDSSAQEKKAIQKMSRPSSLKQQNESFEVNIVSLLEEAKSIMNSDLVSSIDIIEKALDESFNQNDRLSQANCYDLLGDININLAEHITAAGYYEKSVELYKKLKYEGLRKQAELKLANAYANFDNSNAIDVYEALNKSLTDNDPSFFEIKSECLTKLSQLHLLEGNLKKAQKFSEELIAFSEANNNEDLKIIAYEQNGKVYDKFNDQSNSVKSYKKAFEIADNTGNSKGASNYWSNVSKFNATNSSENLELQQQALDYGQNTNNPEIINDASIGLGNYYLEQNKSQEAIPYLEKSIEITTTLNLPAKKEQVLKTISKAYEDVGDYDKALEKYKELALLKDSLNIIENLRVTQSKEISQKLNIKETKIAILEKEWSDSERKFELLQQEKDLELKQRNTVILSLIVGMLIVAVGIIFSLRVAQQRKKANRLLKLKQLRTQMNPHFIFNSLNSVNNFISKNDERLANKYLSEFSKLMRLVLDNTNHDFITLANEVKILDLYIKLEHLRFKDKFDYEFIIPEEIDLDEYNTPPMLIQPYIENAIWHGLRYKETKGNLRVELKEDGDKLIWEVEDNGIGITKSKAIKTPHQKKKSSTGMRNIEDRIKLIKEIFGAKLTTEITELSDNQSGTLVKLKYKY